MKFGSLFLLMINIFLVSFGQNTNSSEYLKQSCYEIGTVYTSHGDKSKAKALDIGTCFFINYNGVIYLATNYHILSGKDPKDKRDYKEEELPDAAVIKFRLKNDKVKMLPVFLKNSTGKEVFFYSKDSSGEIKDLAFLPMSNRVMASDIDFKTISIESIDINSLDTSWMIKPSSNLYAVGFRGDASVQMIYPLIDTFHSVSELSFQYNDPYLFAKSIGSLHGSSGGKVYCNQNGKNEFVAVVSTETNGGFSALALPELVGTGIDYSIYEFVSTSVLKRVFLDLFAHHNE